MFTVVILNFLNKTAHIILNINNKSYFLVVSFSHLNELSPEPTYIIYFIAFMQMVL